MLSWKIHTVDHGEAPVTDDDGRTTVVVEVEMLVAVKAEAVGVATAREPGAAGGDTDWECEQAAAGTAEGALAGYIVALEPYVAGGEGDTRSLGPMAKSAMVAVPFPGAVAGLAR